MSSGTSHTQTCYTPAVCRCVQPTFIYTLQRHTRHCEHPLTHHPDVCYTHRHHHMLGHTHTHIDTCGYPHASSLALHVHAYTNTFSYVHKHPGVPKCPDAKPPPPLYDACSAVGPAPLRLVNSKCLPTQVCLQVPGGVKSPKKGMKPGRGRARKQRPNGRPEVLWPVGESQQKGWGNRGRRRSFPAPSLTTAGQDGDGDELLHPQVRPERGRNLGLESVPSPACGSWPAAPSWASLQVRSTPSLDAPFPAAFALRLAPPGRSEHLPLACTSWRDSPHDGRAQRHQEPPSLPL